VHGEGDLQTWDEGDLYVRLPRSSERDHAAECDAVNDKSPR
jgi:hypothetical protein